MTFFAFSTFRDFVRKDHFPRFARFCGSVCQFFTDGFSIITALCVLCRLERMRARETKSLTYPQSKAWTISLTEGLDG